MKYYIIYLCALSLITVILFGTDKVAAVRRRRRISERTLLSFMLFGGGVGGFIGIYFFRHKSNFRRKYYFHITLWLSLIIEALVAYLIIRIGG